MTHPAPQRDLVSTKVLWFGLFAAPFVWSVQIIVDYALLAHSCYPGRLPIPTGWVGAAWTISLIVSIVSLIVAVIAAVTAFRSWRRTEGEHTGSESALLEVGEGRTRFMAFAGILLSVLFLLGIVLNGIPLFVVPACG